MKKMMFLFSLLLCFSGFSTENIDCKEKIQVETIAELETMSVMNIIMIHHKELFNLIKRTKDATGFSEAELINSLFTQFDISIDQSTDTSFEQDVLKGILLRGITKSNIEVEWKNNLENYVLNEAFSSF